MKRVFKEVAIYIALFIALSVAMHFDAWMTHPIKHIEALPTSPFGPYHPFVFTFALYVAVLIVRIFVHLLRKYIIQGSK